MKYIRQFGIILLITFIGEIMHELIPIPVPAGIYGIVLLFTGLKTGIVPLSEVKDASKFLIQIMPLMFIPAAVGLIDTWEVLSPSWLQFVIVTVVTTVVVMAVSGVATQAVNRLRSRKAENKGVSFCQLRHISAYLSAL